VPGDDSVDPPVTDELFAAPDVVLATALDDVDDLDLAAELVSIEDDLGIDAALDRVRDDPDAVRATIVRAWTTEE
jgi:hypothetical protein